MAIGKSSVLSSSSSLAKSNNTSVTNTFMVKNENDEALIVTSTSIQSPMAFPKSLMTSNTGSKPKRKPLNIQSVLEEITSSQKALENSKDSSRNNTSGHFNLLKTSYASSNISQPIVITKAKKINEESKSWSSSTGNKLFSTSQFLNSTMHKELDNNKHVGELDALRSQAQHPPLFNPDTRTYFKCSIYSP